MSSFTVTLSGTTSELSNTFFPEISLSDDDEYSCALLDLTTYHSIPNISTINNTLKYSIYHLIEDKVTSSDLIQIPVGSYEAHEILDYIKEVFEKKNISFVYKINKNTLKTTIQCSAEIDFTCLYSIHKVLGFDRTKIPRNTETESPNIIKISSQDVIRVKCNIVCGSYINGYPSHTLYEFATNKVDVGYKMLSSRRI